MTNNFSYFLFHPKNVGIPLSLNMNQLISLLGKMILVYLGTIIVTSVLFLPILSLLNLFPEQRIRLSAIPLSFKLIVFVPIYEEVIFRLPLKYSKENIFLSLATLQFLLFYHSFNLIILVCISFLIASVPHWDLIKESFFSKMERVWQRYFPFLYYGLALCFGLFHLTNFENLKLAQYLLFPLLVSNQIIMGLMFGYVRITYKNGFIYSVLLHFFINLPLILISHL